jgi:hypothetical protein
LHTLRYFKPVTMVIISQISFYIIILSNKSSSSTPSLWHGKNSTSTCEKNSTKTSPCPPSVDHIHQQPISHNNHYYLKHVRKTPHRAKDLQVRYRRQTGFFCRKFFFVLYFFFLGLRQPARPGAHLEKFRNPTPIASLIKRSIPNVLKLIPSCLSAPAAAFSSLRLVL